MQQIDIVEAKSNLGHFIEVALHGEEIIITRDNKPLLKLASVQKQKVRRKAGSAKGQITLMDDFDEPLEEFQPYMP
jgi:prevent-host-death family protein